MARHFVATIGNARVWVDECDSVADFGRHASRDTPHWDNDHARKPDKFTGWTSWADTVNAAINGYPSGRARLSDRLAVSQPLMMDTIVPAPAYDIAGAYPDVPLYCVGDPEHMATPTPSDAQGLPVIRLVVDLSASAFQDADMMVTRSAAVLSWALALQAAGWTTEIVMTFCSSSRYAEQFRTVTWAHLVTVTVQQAGAPLDIDAAAFAFCHPGTFRRLGFRCFETEPEGERNIRGTLGYPAPYEGALAQHFARDGTRLAMLRGPGANRDAQELYSSPAAAIRTVGRQVHEQLGLPLPPELA